MSVQQQLAERGVEVQRREHDDGVTYVADLGPGTEASVDVVDETVIVVSDTEQYDIEIDDGDAQAFMRNGVLSIEVTDEVDA